MTFELIIENAKLTAQVKELSEGKRIAMRLVAALVAQAGGQVTILRPDFEAKHHLTYTMDTDECNLTSLREP